uniref:Uncharacterized protein n=1 Tax=Knipowitschia caucasica TaxID=637954 RepID=A0AAV2M177_KNICA
MERRADVMSSDKCTHHLRTGQKRSEKIKAEDQRRWPEEHQKAAVHSRVKQQSKQEFDKWFRGGSDEALGGFAKSITSPN